MSKQYVINSTKQLIDLNDTLINYKIAWRVVSGTPPDAPPFDIAIVNQAVLNSSPNDIEFKTVDNGEISGELENNDNKFQNWYIVLKASQEIPVMVDIQKQEISPVLQQPVHFGAAANIPPPVVGNSPPPRSYTIIIICLLVIIGGGYYWWTTRNKSTDGEKKSSIEASSAEEASSSKASPSKKSSPAKSSGSDSPFAFQRSPETENILKRLGKK